MKLKHVWTALVMLLAVAFIPRIATAEMPASQPSQRVDFITMGDWGTGGAGQKEVAAKMAAYNKKLANPINAALLLGDNFYMSLPGGVKDQAWQNVFEKMYPADQLPFPFYVALGNHDYQDKKDQIELQYAKLHPDSRWKLPARWYRIDLPVEKPLVTVLMLDSDKDQLKELMWNEEKKWIETELAKPRGTWTILCAHHPLFSNGGHGDNPVLQKEWGPLLEKYKVDFYFCGHDHDLQHLQIPNWYTTFVLAGGGGADLKVLRHDDRGPFSRLVHGFAHVQITPDQITVRYVTTEDEITHEFTRKKSGEVEVKINGGNDPAIINPLRALEGITPSKPDDK